MHGNRALQRAFTYIACKLINKYFTTRGSQTAKIGFGKANEEKNEQQATGHDLKTIFKRLG